MTNPNKAKGDRWERDVRTFLSDRFGRLVRRPRQEGFNDVGDLHLSPFALQCKDHAAHSFPAWIRSAELQAAHAGEPFGVVIVKQRGKSAPDGFAVMSVRTFRDLAERLAAAEQGDAL